MLLFTVVAVLLSNSPWADAFLGMWDTRLGLHLGQVEFGRSLRDWINDGLMTLFFFLVALDSSAKSFLARCAIRAWPHFLWQAPWVE